MYKVVETKTNETIHGNMPLVSLADEYGGKAAIVEDDHCLVLMLDVGKGYEPATHWFREAVEAIPETW